MTENNENFILRIYIGSSDKVNQQLLYEYLVFEAKKLGLAGATVLKGILSFGASSVIHSYKFWETLDKVPVVVEIVDEPSKINSYWETVKPVLESVRYGCLATLDRTSVLMYKSGKQRIPGTA
jgi:PII-like signaling protein